MKIIYIMNKGQEKRGDTNEVCGNGKLEDGNETGTTYIQQKGCVAV